MGDDDGRVDFRQSFDVTKPSVKNKAYWEPEVKPGADIVDCGKRAVQNQRSRPMHISTVSRNSSAERCSPDCYGRRIYAPRTGQPRPCGISVAVRIRLGGGSHAVAISFVVDRERIETGVRKTADSREVR